MNRRAGAVAFALIATASVALTQMAHAVFSTSASSTAAYSSAALGTPSSLNVARAICTIAVSDSAQVSWSAPSDNKASGTEILRSTTNGGPYTLVGTVIGSGTSYTDGGLAFATTYYYVARTLKNNWRSATTTQASVTTRSPLCL